MSTKLCSAILLAGGQGKRLGGQAKQLRLVANKPLFMHAALLLDQHPAIGELIIVCAKPLFDLIKNITKEYGLKNITCICGGPRRVDSMAIGFQHAQYEWVLVHDAARPCLSISLLDRIFDAQNQNKKCEAFVAALPASDTIKKIIPSSDKNFWNIDSSLNREELVHAQTPQLFSRSLLERALQKWHQAGKPDYSDDAQLVEALGGDIQMVEGDPANIKVTHLDDLKLVEMKFGQRIRQMQRVGLGYDVHPFADDRDLVIGGEKIPHSQGLLGHSDADVLTHAIADAILGAAGLGDIGTHFPEHDPTIKNENSLNFLTKITSMLKERSFIIINIDATLVAEEPRFAPYIPQMRQNISHVLDISSNAINIKATTTEKLGAMGRKEGISAQAIAMISCQSGTID